MHEILKDLALLFLILILFCISTVLMAAFMPPKEPVYWKFDGVVHSFEWRGVQKP